VESLPTENSREMKEATMEPIGRRLVVLGVAAIGLLAFGGCGGGESEDPSRARLVAVSGADYSFDAPETIADGQTTLRFTNEGEEDHELHLLRLNDGVAIHQFQQALHQDGLEVALGLGEERGHVATVAPGQTGEAAADLSEGEYVLICQLSSPGDGVAHALKGMVAAMTVTAGG
jgi:hypothetical protein